jgi:hypothetical protein
LLGRAGRWTLGDRERGPPEEFLAHVVSWDW